MKLAMKLRTKMLLILFGVWAAIRILSYFYSNSILIDDYQAIEKGEAIKNIQRVSRTLNNFQTSLKVLDGDWSIWDDAYKFMQDKNQTFIDSNLAPSTFVNANISLILFFDTKGKLFYGSNYNLKTKKFVAVPADTIQKLEADKSFSQMNTLNAINTGILETPEGYIMLSAGPIVTSKNQGPIIGTLVMASYFNNQQLAEISTLTDTKISLTPLPAKPQDSDIRTALTHLNAGEPYYLCIVNQHLLYGYTFIYDINKHPIGVLRIQSSRLVYNEGLKTIHEYQKIISLIGLIFILAIWLLLEKLILKRVLNISKQVVDINSENKFGNHILIKGNDEITHMAEAINSLMELIDYSQDQLRGRIKQRTDALEQIAQLNKNLYHEISRQKEVETKLIEDKQTLRQMAYYDTLTGLPNRQSFNELLRKTFLESEEKKSSFAIMFLDADHFKSINDNHGHDIGDQFLIVTAARLQYAIHNKATAARISGDEFYILMTESTQRDILDQIANKILYALSAPVVINHITIQQTFSIGISVYPQDGINTEELRNHADIAMYHAKKQAKNAFCYYVDIKNDERIL